ncbi:MAG: fumarylacetoacetate hydrolase family protein [Thermoanaerobaculaceae bacterium]|jgi:2-keto-4-pentenoate hydratase/2-oxohepta-3-ene-1,7-dioic acid hydratase in catechol pathway
MRLCRIEVAGVPRWGVAEGELVTLLAASPWHDTKRIGGAVPLATVKLLPPCEPTKIVAVGLNFRAHAAEMGKALPTEPVLFLKAPSSLLPPGGAVVLPKQSKQVEHEGELALVIGATAAHVPAARALDYVLGYTCLDDVTARDIQKREQIYARAKGFDTFCPVGPWLETGVADPQRLDIELRVNGIRKQKGTSADMIFTVAEVVAFVSDIMTLYPGDLITTGTPPGVGPLASGDQVEVEITGIGTLRHTVA